MISIFLNVLIFTLIYTVLHFLPDFINNPFTRILGAPYESLFHHVKIGFFSMILLHIGKVVFLHISQNKVPENYEARLLSCILIPFILFMLWWIIPAYTGKLSPSFIEIIWSITITIIGGILVFSIYPSLSFIKWNIPARLAIWFIFLNFLWFFIHFSISKPYRDFFQL